MNYIIAAVCFAICIAVIIFGLRVLKESREMGPKKPLDDDDDEPRNLRP
jgi:MFS superfamily sulfate permease-like transporter